MSSIKQKLKTEINDLRSAVSVTELKIKGRLGTAVRTGK
jgi:hypothetical protein